MNGFFDAFRGFFENEALSPHGICLLWRPELIWTHAVSDVLIGLAYFSIPLALGVFLYHRRDVRFSWAIWMFVGFIMLCGVTHFMMVWTLWNPDYGIEALIKGATAGVSLVTAVALWPLLPKAIAIPSSEALHARIAERDRALDELRAAMATMLEMREHEKRQKLLLDELNHRVKNTLAAVQSIAVQTLNRAGDIKEFKETFLERLLALSSTHNLLVKDQWESASFRELVAATLDHYDRPYTVEGPDLRLHPNYAVSLGLAVHELATNALKYGAWSSGGEVVIQVSAVPEERDGCVRIVWREKGGRRISPPSVRGFGSRLLEHGVAAELGGSVVLAFAPEGVACTIEVPASDRMRVETPPPVPA